MRRRIKIARRMRQLGQNDWLAYLFNRRPVLAWWEEELLLGERPGYGKK